MASTILLIGGTGNVGKPLVTALHESKADVKIRVLTRDVGKGRSAIGDINEHVDWVQGSIAEDEDIKKALDGVDRLFITTPRNDLEGKIAELAKEAGVKHIVKISAIFASTASPPGSFIYSHYQAELAVAATGIPYTFLRCHDFTQNIVVHSLPALKATGGKLYNAVDPTNYLSSVDCRDIADAAAAVLTGPIDKFGFRGYDLTGPDALTYPAMFKIIEEVTGTKYEHVRVGDAQLYKSLQGFGLPENFAHALVKLDQFYRLNGTTPFVSGDVEILTGHPARSYKAFIEENKNLFA